MEYFPKISIITVCYNSAATIESTILSVLGQSYKNIEYIIVDGKSKDSTLEIVNRYKDRIAQIISEKDAGIFDAFNKGISMANGEIIGIINSDDMYADEFVIEQVVQCFNKYHTDTVYGDLVYVDKVHPSKVIRYWKSCDYNQRLFKWGWMPPHPTYFVKSELYKKFGIFNLEMKISNDYEIILRFLHKHKCSASYLHKIFVMMRTGGNSDGGIKRRMKANKEDKMSWKMNGLHIGLFTALLKPLRKLNQFFIPKHIKKLIAEKSKKWITDLSLH